MKICIAMHIDAAIRKSGAPEMYAACQRAQNVFAGWRRDADPDYDTKRGYSAELDAAWDNLEAMQAAIAKAEGRAA